VMFYVPFMKAHGNEPPKSPRGWFMRPVYWFNRRTWPRVMLRFGIGWARDGDGPWRYGLWKTPS
jgi:hypothetical protein